MTVPIQIPWDLYLGKLSVYAETVAVGVRRAVLLPRLDVIFSPIEESPTRALAYGDMDWRLISPTESDWSRYIEMVEKQAKHSRISYHIQRVENVARWMGGRQFAVPQYHLWLYRDHDVADALQRLYEDPGSESRREMWRWLLSWSAPNATTGRNF